MNYRRDDGTGDYQKWAQGEKQKNWINQAGPGVPPMQQNAQMEQPPTLTAPF